MILFVHKTRGPAGPLCVYCGDVSVFAAEVFEGTLLGNANPGFTLHAPDNFGKLFLYREKGKGKQKH
jgi:hypothetical protein